MSIQINNESIAVLASDVRHFTKAVEKLVADMEEHKDVLHSKADAAEVISLREDVIVLNERQKNDHKLILHNQNAVTKVKTRITKLEMETWKLGLMLSGTATGGGLIALLGKYLTSLVL